MAAQPGVRELMAALSAACATKSGQPRACRTVVTSATERLAHRRMELSGLSAPERTFPLPVGNWIAMLLRMKTDLCTKSLLTVIAVLLAIIAVELSGRPASAVQAAGQFSGVQYASTLGTVSFFNPNTGEVYIYSADPGSPKGGTVLAAWKFTQLGANAAKATKTTVRDSWLNP